MTFTIIALVIAVACVVASVRRIAFVAAASGYDAGVLLMAVREAPSSWPHIQREIKNDPAAAWEGELIDAIGSKQIALVNEQLSELDHETQRWGRVPRVCASVASSSGFLLAALVMRDALAADVVDVDVAIGTAINVVVIGLASTAFCVAAHLRARIMVKERLATTDRLIERLEALT